MMTDQPPAAAVAQGHELTWDPPHGLSRASRWTCFRPGCGATAIRYDGNEYGSALEDRCPDA